MSSDAMMRHLLGSDKKVVHDPGPKGESGEGDAALVMIFLVIAAAAIITIYGALKRHRRPALPTRAESRETAHDSSPDFRFTEKFFRKHDGLDPDAGDFI